jgi:ribosomal protein S18 acetylase RimI-like enzyme
VFDARDPANIELVHYGILPELQGRGLGRFLLDTGLRFVWARRPARVWLHTDTNDHPGALPLYLQLGFGQYAQRIEEFAD